MNQEAKRQRPRRIVGLLVRRWHIILLFLISGIVAALAFLAIVPPRFSAEATLAFDADRDRSASGEQAQAADAIERLIIGEVAIIQSRGLIRRVVETEKLVDDPEFNRIEVFDFLRELFADIQDQIEEPESSLDPVVNRFRQKLLVHNPDRSLRISVRLESRDRTKSARLANALVNAYLAQHLEEEIEEDQTATQWRQERVAALRAKWRRSVSKIDAFRAANNLKAVAGGRSGNEDVAKLNDSLALARANANAARNRVERARRLVANRDATSLANTVRSRTMRRLSKRLSTASRQEATLSETLLPAHPTLKQAMERKARLQRQVIAEGRNALQRFEAAHKAAQEREKKIQTTLNTTVATLQAAGNKFAELRELELAAASDKAKYDDFLKRLRETPKKPAKKKRKSPHTNFRLLEKAKPPMAPTTASQTKVLSLATLGSLALGFMAAFFRDALSRQTPETAPPRVPQPSPRPAPVAVHPQPPVATLPTASVAAAKRRGLAVRRERLVVQDPDSAYAQAMSALTHQLTGDSDRDTGMIVAVTSAVGREGKTMVASSIAQQAALDGRKTVLIDCNFANRDATALFRAFHDWTAARGDKAGDQLEPTILTDPKTGLDIVPAYADLNEALRYVGSRAFADLLNSARAFFDLVIVDTGALLTYPEPRVLAGMADVTLLVVDDRTTSQALRSQALALLANCRANGIAVVTNHARSAQPEASDPANRLPDAVTHAQVTVSRTDRKASQRMGV